MTVSTYTTDLCGVTFELDQLRDIAQHGANAGVPGFIYSSELHDKWERYSDEVTDYLEDYADACFGKSWESMIVDQLDSEDWTMQELKEKAIWAYLELRAQEETAE
jgi:hypothetical protein